MLNSPADGFLALLYPQLCKVVVGVYICGALADLFLPGDEVFVAFHYIPSDLQVHYAVLPLHC